MIIKNYLDRINYTGPLDPNLEVLKSLQLHHLLSVPFENLDIHYGRVIKLDISKFYKKIVVEKRGGFCYELNGLFQTLLNELGFQTKLIAATVYDSDKEVYTKENGHAAIIVTIDKSEYLVDVGFGEFVFNPLFLEVDKIQEDSRGLFVIQKEKEINRFVVYKIKNDSKTKQYLFTTKAKTLNSFQEMCNYQQTSPNSHFISKKIISRPIPNGRITITGNTLKITENGADKETIEFPKDDFKKYLFKWFGLEEGDLIG